MLKKFWKNSSFGYGNNFFSVELFGHKFCNKSVTASANLVKSNEHILRIVLENTFFTPRLALAGKWIYNLAIVVADVPAWTDGLISY